MGVEERGAEELMQQLRSKATELLLREQWQESIQIYTQIINLCEKQIPETSEVDRDQDRVIRLRKSLCLALSNRAEARSRLKYFSTALGDCDRSLQVDSTHFKSLLCKGKILLALSKYSMALTCFERALLDPLASDNLETVNGYLQKCKKLEFQSKTGSFDLSDWILCGFRGKPPELAEFIGSVQIKKSEIRGRALFATKNIAVGSLILVTKAIAIERGILGGQDSCEKAQLIMWKNFIDKVMESVKKCPRTNKLVAALSTGQDEDTLAIPDIKLFMPETTQEVEDHPDDCTVDKDTILSILDVNSLIEDGASAKVIGKNRDYYGVGLWTLASLLNHSCVPNARRVHVGDHVMVHASRDIKAGEEITFAYFDVLSPLENRKAMSDQWGFHCECQRCRFEENLGRKKGFEELEFGLESGCDNAVYVLEEGMKRLGVKGREKGFLRASYWAEYEGVYSSERAMKRWVRRIPSEEAVVESVFEALGGDERVVKVVVEGMKRKSNGGSKLVEIERAMKLGRAVYGKAVAKKKALRALLGLDQ